MKNLLGRITALGTSIKEEINKIDITSIREKIDQSIVDFRNIETVQNTEDLFLKAPENVIKIDICQIDIVLRMLSKQGVKYTLITPKTKRKKEIFDWIRENIEKDTIVFFEGGQMIVCAEIHSTTEEI